MKRYTPEELQTVLAEHKLWRESCGNEGARADLTDADLTDTYLTGAYLTGANLRGADLRSADLRGADLSGADLRSADLSGANLSDADLRRAVLRRADLSGADLSGADLSDADLSDADLRRADLRGANLSDADLTGAYLTGDFKIQKTAVIAGLYTYLAMPIIADDSTEWVRLGCYTRTVADWESNFWNNNREFPNDGSAKSRERELAYRTCLAWLEIHREPAASLLPAAQEEREG